MTMYFDSFSGLVPVELIGRVKAGGMHWGAPRIELIRCRVIRDCGPYHKGEILEEFARHIVERRPNRGPYLMCATVACAHLPEVS